MHELSIAQSILDIVYHAVPADQQNLVRIVRLRLGEQAGVVPDSLEFSFTALIAGTPLAAVRLEMEQIPYIIHCKICHATLRSEPGLRPCPECGSVETQVLSGTELQITEIELDDDHKEAP